MATTSLTPVIVRAVTYYRYSTPEQTDNSIDRQDDDCRFYIDQIGAVFIRSFFDRAKSGADDDRQGLIDALDFIINGGADILVVESISRLGRDAEIIGYVSNKLKQYKIKLHSVRHDGEYIRQSDALAEAAYAVKFREDCRELSVKGLRKAVSKGTLTVSWYGYKTIPGRPGERIKVKSKLAIVERIYKMYVGDGYDFDYTPDEIADYLNDDSVPPPRSCGKKWHGSSVLKILENTIYVGHWVYYRADGPGDKAFAPIPTEHPELAHIDLKLWERAATKRAARSKSHTRHSYHRDLLKGIIVCSHCERALFRRRDRASGGVVFRCPGRGHTAYQIPAAAVEGELQRILRGLLDGEAFEREFEENKQDRIATTSARLTEEICRHRVIESEEATLIANYDRPTFMPDLEADEREALKKLAVERWRQERTEIARKEGQLRLYAAVDRKASNVRSTLRRLATEGLPQDNLFARDSSLKALRAVIPQIAVTFDPKLQCFRLLFLIASGSSPDGATATSGYRGYEVSCFRTMKRERDDPYLAIVGQLAAQGRWSVPNRDAARFLKEVPSAEHAMVGLNTRLVDILRAISVYAHTGLNLTNTEYALGMRSGALTIFQRYLCKRVGSQLVADTLRKVASASWGPLPSDLLMRNRPKSACLLILGPYRELHDCKLISVAEPSERVHLTPGSNLKMAARLEMR